MRNLFSRSLFSARKLWLAWGVIAIALAVFTAPSALAFNNGGTITSSLNPSLYGQNVTFTASFGVTATAPTVKAPGTINFYDGSNLLASVQGTGVPVSASFSTSALSVGTHTISAVLGPATASLNQVVNGPADVPEGDTLLLLAGGMGGMGVWLRYQWGKRRAQK